MKETKDYFIRNDLPESLNRENVKELAQLADTLLHGFDEKILGVLIYPAIDNLPSDLVDALAIQLHCDFYDSRLPLKTRRKLVKSSIAWHRIKGTPAAVEMLLQTLYQDAHVSEWFEYGGRPYFFRVGVDISNTEEGANPDTMAQVKKVIELAKNVRSWLDLLEFQIHIKEELEITEDRWWIVHIVNSAKELYPWRGRFFNTSWTFVPHVTFDGTWSLDGEYRFDDVPVGAEDAAEKRFAFDGDWWFDGTSRFGYPVSRKILWGTQEPDELTVVPRSAIKEQYAVTLPLDVLSPFDTGWAFGARDGPQETAFSASVSPALSEGVSLQEAEETITVLRAVLRDIYPMPHILSFDSTWEFHAPICMDGTWGFDGNARQRFGDARHEPWKNLPILFFDEQREAVISYKEIQLCFDGTWEFTRNGTRHFDDTIEIPRIEQMDGTPYDGRLYDGSWKFFGLHSAGVFWNEDAQERFALLEEEPESEKLEAQETAAISAEAGFTDSMFSKKVFDGAWGFSGVQVFGSGSAMFEELPAFSEGRFFDRSWDFGLCGRLFDGSWKLGESSCHFDSSWHFGGEEYFQEDGRKEASDIGLRSVLSDRLEHFRQFGEGLAFDGEWSLGGITGPQETKIPWQIATSMEEEEPLRDEARISVSVAFREHAPISPVPSFNGEWTFPETYMFDGAWQFGSGTVFGEAARETSLPNGEKIFREKSVEERLFVEKQPTTTISDTMTRTNAFGEGLAFDGEWNFGEQEGCSESIGVLVSVDLRLLEDEPDPEKLEAQETAAISAGAGFTDSMFSKKVFDGAWGFSGVQVFGSGSAMFEELPAFSEGRFFDRSWDFGLCGRLFDGSWKLGESSCHFDSSWHFGGEEYFQEDGRKEASDIGLRSVLSDRLEHFQRFGEELFFDGEWSLGEQEGCSESMAVFVSVGLRFDGTWDFDGEARVLDGAWSLGTDSYSFGENAEPRNHFDGTWNFTDSGTRIRFERRWNSFGIETIAA